MAARKNLPGWLRNVHVLSIFLVLLGLVASQKAESLESQHTSCQRDASSVAPGGSSLLQASTAHVTKAQLPGGGPSEVGMNLKLQEEDIVVGTAGQEDKSVGEGISGLRTTLAKWYGSATSVAARLPGVSTGGWALDVVKARVTTFSASTKRQSHFGYAVVIIMIVALAISFYYVTRAESRSNLAKLPTANRIDQRNTSRSPLVGARTTGGNAGVQSTPAHFGARSTTAQFAAPGGSPTFSTHSAYDPSLRSAASLARGRAASESSAEEDNEERAQFCPDLVVPEQCECILVVPVYAPNGSFSICDMHGRAVLHAFTSANGAAWRLDVQSATGETLARCVEARPSVGSAAAGNGFEFHMLDAHGQFYARLVQLHGEERFVLTTQSGLKLHLWGNFQTQAINVSDEEDSLLATTEPCGADFGQTGSYYRLRVAPLENVGHSLCALLCIGQILRARQGSAVH